MTKLTSSDIKKTLIEKFGGAAADWKRLNKTKNTAGEVERKFLETSQDILVLVTEKADGLSYTRLDNQTTEHSPLEEEVRNVARMQRRKKELFAILNAMQNKKK